MVCVCMYVYAVGKEKKPIYCQSFDYLLLFFFLLFRQSTNDCSEAFSTEAAANVTLLFIRLQYGHIWYL